MCLRTSNVVAASGTNWQGDRIADPVVQAARHIPATSQRYAIDIREFLTTRNNAVVRAALDDAVALLKEPAQRDLFWARKAGSFDHKVRAICAYLGSTIHYKRRPERHFDAWLFPDETLAAHGGDCEDQAFLLAALILASGVSSYVVRVALGKLRDTTSGETRDHVWVMYQNEGGHWLTLDPLLYTRDSEKAASAPQDAVADRDAPSTESTLEYVPLYVFNDSHLWAMGPRDDSPSLNDYVHTRNFWRDFDPTFAASVHNSILDSALGKMNWFSRLYVKAVSLAVDANIAAYDPRDHFDNAAIAEGWQRVDRRLATGSLDDFALACHAIADFYAHSSWGVFGERVNGRLAPLLAHAAPRFETEPSYTAGGKFPLDDAKRFSVNEGVWRGTRAEVAALWHGKIISGRYAQIADPHQSTFERLTYIPKALRDAPGYHDWTSLPHHDEIAVDQPSRAGTHRLYLTDATYKAAFAERVAAATAHIRALYDRWA